MSPNRTEHWTDRLSDYLDGELNREQRAACEAHLEDCRECSAVLEQLRVVVARAGALPPLPPASDLWPVIEPRLRRRLPGLALLDRWRDRLTRRISLSGAQLVAAAAALVVVSGGVTWMLTQRHAAPQPAASGPVAVAPGARVPQTSVTPGGSPTPAPPVTPGGASRPAQSPAIGVPPTSEAPPATVADFGVARYDATIRELQSALDSHRSRLDPHTVQVVEQNLALIDRAIAEARAALAADPASPYLNAHLASTMRRKVNLLRRLNSLAQI